LGNGFKSARKSFANEAEAIEWMIRNQLGRRKSLAGRRQ